MNSNDFYFILQWWTVLFVIGMIFLPLTTSIFPNFFDKGYVFAKIIGIAIISYCIFILGFLKILPFSNLSILLVISIFIAINLFVFVKDQPLQRLRLKTNWKIFAFEEILFLGILFFWSFIHAHQPDIHGLEKYMDFGFINSILRTEYFPPKDMWLTPFYINYYYFGHLTTAVLTKLSFLPSSVTFNLMLSTISALSFVSAFSIGANLVYQFKIQNSKFKIARLHLPSQSDGGQASQKLKVLAGGLLTAFILNFAGNLHTIYLFFKPYQNENPVPFWNLIFSPFTFPNSYWYPNATRFIYNTIHEFPIYSYVVSDLHGHVLDIPFVLFTIAVLLSLIFNFQFSIFNQIKNLKNSNSFQISNFKFQIVLLAFLLATMYMTNAWDGIIYFTLAVFFFSYIILKSILNPDVIKNSKLKIQNYPLRSEASSSKFKIFITLFIPKILLIGFLFFLFTLPFNLNFKPFASGIGILCAPKFLTDLGRLGPFTFELNHCQRSPLWQLFILYGFFYFWVISFIVFLKLNATLRLRSGRERYTLNASDVFVLILVTLSTLLIILPEFIYVKDIYPAHYRANTMFKLVYQAFIMLSIASGYIIIRILNIKHQISKMQIKNKIFNFYYVYLLFAILFFMLVMIYPYFAINSYFGNLKNYQGLDGTKYLKTLYPADYEAVSWINKNIKGQPIILEAQGDSYTDYGRVSTNTGLPTVLGWTVHEWLWRGTYDIPAPRIPEIEKMYVSVNPDETKNLLKKYNISLVFIGDLERQKYPNINIKKFNSLGKIIYKIGDTNIYQISIQ